MRTEQTTGQTDERAVLNNIFRIFHNSVQNHLFYSAIPETNVRELVNSLVGIWGKCLKSHSSQSHPNRICGKWMTPEAVCDSERESADYSVEIEKGCKLWGFTVREGEEFFNSLKMHLYRNVSIRIPGGVVKARDSRLYFICD